MQLAKSLINSSINRLNELKLKFIQLCSSEFRIIIEIESKDYLLNNQTKYTCFIYNL